MLGYFSMTKLKTQLITQSGFQDRNLTVNIPAAELFFVQSLHAHRSRNIWLEIWPPASFDQLL
jgi:hypothetical protein